MATFNLTFEIPDSEADKLVDDLAKILGYKDQVGEAVIVNGEETLSPNPQSKVDFIKQEIGRELIEKVIGYRAAIARNLANDQTSEQAKSLVAACSVS